MARPKNNKKSQAKKASQKPQNTEVESVVKTATSNSDVKIKIVEARENAEESPGTSLSSKTKPLFDYLNQKHQLNYSCWQAILVLLILFTILTLQLITFLPENTDNPSKTNNTPTNNTSTNPPEINTPDDLNTHRIKTYPNHTVYVYDWSSNDFSGSFVGCHQYTVPTDKIKIHNSWQYDSDAFAFDIAILEVERPDFHLNPVPVASASDFENLNRCDFFTAFGTGTKEDGYLSGEQLLKSDDLQFVDCDSLSYYEYWKNGTLEAAYNIKPEFNHALCVNSTVKYQNQVHNGVSQNDASQTCQGDSGGPLVHDGKLFGVTSYGFPPCTSGLPSVFASVAHFHENGWLAENSDFVSGGVGSGVTACNVSVDGRIVMETVDRKVLNPSLEIQLNRVDYSTADRVIRDTFYKSETNRSSRIVNGINVTDVNEAPYYSRILSCNQGGHDCSTCGASWITGKYLVTAAHCVDPQQYYHLYG